MSLERLVAICAGCAIGQRRDWDSKQSFATIALTHRRAYEVADAIARNDMDALADELGDLQLQVVFHSQMAEEAGHFTLDDVLGAICDKLERRHPHLFGGAAASPGWEAIKAAERQKHPDESALAGVALALPALERARKCSGGRRAPLRLARRRRPAGEEARTCGARRRDRAGAREEELGDLLFALVNLARHLNIDAEEALRKANRKFEARFRAIEKEPGFDALSLDEKEALWVRAKADAKQAQADSSA